ncbi:MAG: hypothetical protein K5650_04015 [Bacteroidales bacterium]|nr:hypothetical protein [Bacteroidales bacterium]
MKMKHLFLAALMLAGTLAASAQIEIPGTKASCSLSGEKWKFLRTINVDKNTNVYLFSYKAELLVDADGEETLPYLKIFVRKNYRKSIYEMVYDRYVQQPYQAIEEYSSGNGLPDKGGLGYVGIYTNPQDDKIYMFNMNCWLEGTTAIEFRLETTQNNYEHMKPEFMSILNSISTQ